jgi:putative membrane protein
MFLEILLFFAVGTALGVLAGLIPGLHPNTILITLLSFFWLLDDFPLYYALALMVSMAVSNTIVNFIPSIFVGAPDPSTCLSVLPGHRLLARGEGYHALHLTVVGGVSVMMLTVLAFPFLLWFIPVVYTGIYTYMHWLLLAVLASLLVQERGIKKVHALMFFLISGIAGFILMSTLPSQQVLFPSLTGLFGISIIITSMAHSVSLPPQHERRMKRQRMMKGSVAGWLAGMFVGILPGIGAAQAGVLANSILRGREKDFLIALGGINTANIMFTFMALHAISKTRSGAAVVMSEIAGRISMGDLYFITLIALLACFVSSVLTLWLGRRAVSMLGRFSYRRINTAVLLSITALLLAFSGIGGLFIAAVCTVIGVSCAHLGIKRMYLMGFLMLPTMLYFSGLSPNVLAFLGL